jgi:hypothetical protein
MENSKAYANLLKQMNTRGSQKGDGYNPKILDEVYDWEREEVEELIWRGFQEEKDGDLAVFLPKLKKYDGIGSLKVALQKCKIPSGRSVLISQILYENTGNADYLDVIKQKIYKEENKISYVATLAYCTPCSKAYNFLVDIYIRSDNEYIRSTAITGMLYNKGIITNPTNIKEITSKIELSRRFMVADINERKRIVEMFERGQLTEND